MNNTHTKPGCVVTGVAGFVGSHLAERLLEGGYPVVGLDNFFSGRRENLAHFLDHPAFTFYEADVSHEGLLERLRSDHPEVSYCFHLAAIVSVPYSMEHPDATMETNYRATVRLLGEANRLGFNAFVFAGSAAEYGDDQRIPLREELASEDTHHLSPYGRAKFLASRDVALCPCGVALRFFNIYGPRQDPMSPYSGVITRFIDRIAGGEGLTVFGDGFQTRDFVYISDVVEAYMRAAGLEAQRGFPQGVYNVGTGKSTTILELANILLDISASESRLQFLPDRPGDIRHSQAAVDKLWSVSGWRPRVPLQEGLRKMLLGP